MMLELAEREERQVRLSVYTKWTEWSVDDFFSEILLYKQKTLSLLPKPTDSKMGGGLMQLVAFGAQDIYLTGQPQITFFKVVYRRYTNFAMESIEQTFNGAADFGKKMTCTISRNGDLLHKVYLRVELPDVTVKQNSSFRWLNWLGHILLRSVEIEIGGQRIDKHYGDWLHMWNELTQTAGHQLGYQNMVGNVPQLTNPRTTGSEETEVEGETLYIPLEFWFCRNPGLALPLIALQYHEVKLTLELAERRDCFWAADYDDAATGMDKYTPNASRAEFQTGLKSASLFVDYVYLDTDERRRFAQMSHEYLIEQLQFSGDESTSNTNNKVKLTFNHPVKSLYWNIQPDDNVDESVAPFGKQWFNYTDTVDETMRSEPISTEREAYSGSMPGVAAGGTTGVFMPVTFEGGKNPMVEGKLQLNGHDRTSERDGKYYNIVQPYQHHENVPKAGVNMYSFALKPEEHQPSGTCNFSRIDNAVLHMKLTKTAVENNKTARIRVYALSYNVLRIMSGMGGLEKVSKLPFSAIVSCFKRLLRRC